MLLWHAQRNPAYYHLGAFNELGYAQRASFALFIYAFEYFMRIPAHLGRQFRSMPATHSGKGRPPVPAQAGHLTSG